MDRGVVTIVIIFFLMFFPLTSMGQEKPRCSDGTVLDNSTGQCILACGEGTTQINQTLNGKTETVCGPDETWFRNLGQIEVIAGGIITGILATAFGIGWTIYQNWKQRKKEDTVIIQDYGSKLSEIVNEEQNLETKLDCTLYVERFLDTLEELASLIKKGAVRKNISDYFENKFSYGRNLWEWYMQNVEKIDKDLLDDEWKKENPEDRWREFKWWCKKEGHIERIYHIGRYLKGEITIFEPRNRTELLEKRIEKLEEKISSENDEAKKGRRVIHKKILSDIKKVIDPKNQDKKESKDEEIFNIVQEANKKLPDGVEKFKHFDFINRYREDQQFLPEAMLSDYDDIPEENGMTNDELVEIIQRFGEILNNISNKERNLYSKLDCSLYAEQYLDTLEQIATLYRRGVIPKKAADYFENKFSYGINLLNWYEKFVTKKGCSCEKPSYNDEDVCKNCKGNSEFDSKKSIFEIKDNETWSDFKWFCKGGENPKTRITKFNETVLLIDFLKSQKNKLGNDKTVLEDKISQLEEKNESVERETFRLQIYEKIYDLYDEIDNRKEVKENEKLTKKEKSEYENLKKAWELGKLTKDTKEKYEKLNEKRKLTEDEEREFVIVYFSDFNKKISEIIKDKNDEIDERIKEKENEKLKENEKSEYENLKEKWESKNLTKDTKEKYEKLNEKRKLTDDEEKEFAKFHPREFIKSYGKGGQSAVLPDTMYEYDWLPEEEGMKPSEVLEIMRRYNDQLTDLTGKETDLLTKIDCSIYAEQYLDTLEQIAYLFNDKALATDVLSFFENHFSYGVTLKKWYDKVVLGAESQEERWSEFEIYCKNFEDEFGVKKPITGFGVVDALPTAMIFYEKLALDKSDLRDPQRKNQLSKFTYPPTNDPNWQKKMSEFYED